jgi:hypothetical protein
MCTPYYMLQTLTCIHCGKMSACKVLHHPPLLCFYACSHPACHSCVALLMCCPVVVCVLLACCILCVMTPSVPLHAAIRPVHVKLLTLTIATLLQCVSHPHGRCRDMPCECNLYAYGACVENLPLPVCGLTPCVPCMATDTLTDRGAACEKPHSLTTMYASDWCCRMPGMYALPMSTTHRATP